MLRTHLAPLLALALVTLACGRTRIDEAAAEAEHTTSATDTPAHQNGSRLHARYFLTEDRARQLERLDDADPATQVWFDMQLQVPCALQQVGSGYWCVPTTPLTAWTNPYANSTCKSKQPVASLRANMFGQPEAAFELGLPQRDVLCGQRRFAVTQDPNDPGTPPRVFELGNWLDFAEWGDPNPDCRYSGPPESQLTYALERELNQTELVTGRLERTTTGRRLSLDEIVMSDGARQAVSYFDEQLQTPCSVVLAADQTRRCVPKTQSAVRASPRFLDAECRESTYVTAERLAPGTFVNLAVDSRYQEPSLGIYRIEALPPTLYWFVNGVCQAVPPNAQVSPVLLMAEIEPSEMVEFFDRVEHHGALDVTTDSDAEGSPSLGPSRLLDTSSGEACSFRLLDDGQPHCAPRFARLVYTDDSCVQQSALKAPIGSSAAEPPAKYAADWSGETCSGGQGLFELGSGSPQLYSFFYRDLSGNCVSDNVSGFMSPGAYSVGRSVPSSRFQIGASLVE